MRAEGEMKAVEIRSKADADRTRKISEAQRDSQKLRGEGDKIAIQVMADAMNKDPQFYSYYRTLEAYRTSLRSDNTSYLLSPDSKFFEVFGKPADR